jgi:modulator of FtsH protease HflK
MAWNDPGNGKDPWKRGDEEPNDLDKIVQNWQKRLGGLFGGGKAGAGRRKPGSGGGGWFILLFALVAWALTGFYRVDEAERGVVQRFGKYIKTTTPGLHWHLPVPIETVDVVNTIRITDYPYRTEMLTADMQYVFIDMVVQYRRSDPVKYSFEVENPEITLKDVTESALREVVGTSELESLVASGRRDEIASRTLATLQNTLDDYGAGITVTSVSLKDVKYPQNVQNAVDDAQKARNDADRYALEADAYARDIIPRARGESAKVLEGAQAYRAQVIANAEGEAARFEALLTEYEKAPEVTRERLYIEAVEDVYGNASKVIVDSDGSGNLMYLPIDKLLENRRNQEGSGPEDNNTAASDAAAAEADASRDNARERRTR